MKATTLYIIPLVMFAVGGCATTGAPIPFESLTPVREVAHPAPGRWEVEEGILTNVIPANASPESIRAGYQGAGVVLGLIEEFSAQDLDLSATVSYEENAAVGLLFHAEREDSLLKSALFLALNAGGVFMWRYEDSVWHRIGEHRIAIPAMEPHRIAVQVRGDSIRTFLNDVRVLSGTHGGALGGGAGIAVRAGIGHIHALHVRARD